MFLCVLRWSINPALVRLLGSNYKRKRKKENEPKWTISPIYRIFSFTSFVSFFRILNADENDGDNINIPQVMHVFVLSCLETL